MPSTDKLFAGSIPETYERFLVPLIFESYAADLAKRAAETEPQDVLETAAGTGVLTRALASCLPQDTRITATDLNAPMLDHAAARQPNNRRIAWQQADAMALPFAAEAFDIVACQFGAMFFPDKVQGYKEARRVLRSGGRFIFSVWDQISENEFADVVTEALAAIFPDDPPRFMARVPHGYHNVERGFPALRRTPSMAQARLPRRATPRLRIVRGPHCAAKSRRGTPPAWNTRRQPQRKLWRADLAMVLSKAGSGQS